MAWFGSFCLWVSLICGVFSLVTYGAASAGRVNDKRRDAFCRTGRALYVVSAAAILSASVTLGTLLVTHRFDIDYVYQHSARAMSSLYWLPSFWAGQEGSFLLWASWSSILGIVLALTSGPFERRVMSVFVFVPIFLLTLLVIHTPFVPTVDQFGLPIHPTEGLGLNPNLENPWMVIHPPTLFLGFSSLAIPFAYAVAAGLWKDWDSWLRRALPWALFGFSVLGLAMMMGGYWAYEMLGWGGFWEWDPVENGPFIPWIALVGFLHAAQIQRVRGGFTKPTVFFAAVPFVGAMFESYMTRSGILTDFSVHSFSELGGIRNNLLLGGLLAALGAACALLFTHPQDSRPIEKRNSAVWEIPASREYAFTLALILMTLCAIIAAIGMSAPALTALGVKLGVAHYTASVSEDYHNIAMFPLALLICAGLGVAPHLSWYGSSPVRNIRLLAAYVISVIGAVCFVAAAHWLGTSLTGPHLVPQILLLTVTVFAIVSNGYLLLRTLLCRTEMSVRVSLSLAKVGGFVSHIGAALLLLGIACLVTFVRKDPDVVLVKGSPKSVLNGAYTLTYRGQSGDYENDKDNALLFDVASRDKKEIFIARLPFALRSIEGGDKKLFGHPSITHHLGEDLYIALKDGPDQYYPQGRYVEDIGLGSSRVLGPYTLQFERFERDPQAAAYVQTFGQMPAVFPMWAVVKVKYRGETTELHPEYIVHRDSPSTPDTPELKMPGGWLLSYSNGAGAIDAGSADAAHPNVGAMNEKSTFILRPEGPALEAFQLDITTRPMISLIWIGTILLFSGGLLSMRRRILENSALSIPDKATAGRHSIELPETAGRKLPGIQGA